MGSLLRLIQDDSSVWEHDGHGESSRVIERRPRMAIYLTHRIGIPEQTYPPEEQAVTGRGGFRYAFSVRGEEEKGVKI